MESITEVKSDYYLMDATGHMVALRTSVTPTGLGTNTNWEYYGYGAERKARLVNLDSDPKFDDASQGLGHSLAPNLQRSTNIRYLSSGAINIGNGIMAFDPVMAHSMSWVL